MFVDIDVFWGLWVLWFVVGVVVGVVFGVVGILL